MTRNLPRLANNRYDVAVVGGGMYGACVAWDASLRGLSVVLLEKGDFGKIRARSYDLVLNGSEIGSGSVRIHKKDMQKKIFDIIGLEKKEAQERFGFLLKAFEYGAPPHAGAAYGVDRLVAILAGLDSIRDTIAFPKTQKGNCLMTDAPSKIDQGQLEELGLMTINKGDKDA